jgi:hypothetical protein
VSETAVWVAEIDVPAIESIHIRGDSYFLEAIVLRTHCKHDMPSEGKTVRLIGL